MPQMKLLAVICIILNITIKHFGEYHVHCKRYVYNMHCFYLSIDATQETGKLGRLINHSRTSSNLYTKTVLVDGLPRLVALI